MHAAQQQTSRPLPISRSYGLLPRTRLATPPGGPASLHHVQAAAGIAKPSESWLQSRPLDATLLPPVVNWFLIPNCNYRCKFCFATFKDFDHREVLADRETLMQVPRLLKEAGCSKITFVGGEPFLHPLIEPLIQEAKAQGMTTSAVTNGSCLNEARLKLLAPHLDWLAFSLDASSDSLHAQMGRGFSHEVLPASALAPAEQQVPLNSHLGRTQKLWGIARSLGIRLKLNTVVCRTNVDDDMSALLLQLRPDRWKVFQVLPVEGQNSGRVEPLLISGEEFASWVDRHRQQLGPQGINVVDESNLKMRGTYAMLDARGRFFINNSPGFSGHVYSSTIYEQGGVRAAWAEMVRHFDVQQFASRGGVYDWGQGREALQEQQHRWSPSSSSPA